LPPPPPPQHHNGYIYATAHAYKVKSRIRVQDNDGVYSGVVIGDGFEIAPGDASDIEVTNAYPWQCLELFFSDDQRANTALGLKTKQPLGHPSCPTVFNQMNMRPGMARSFSKRKPVLLPHDENRCEDAVNKNVR
jgi:hypothetical protein